MGNALELPETPVGLIFTHISQHARLEIPMNLREPIAFSPPRPETRARGARSKDVRKHEGVTPGAFNGCHLALRQWQLTFTLA